MRKRLPALEQLYQQPSKQTPDNDNSWPASSALQAFSHTQLTKQYVDEQVSDSIVIGNA